MNSARVGRLAIGFAIVAATASAQGPPPFEIAAPGYSSQQVWMSINIDDPQSFQRTLTAFGSASGENEQQEDPSDGGRVLIKTAAYNVSSLCAGDYNHEFAVSYWDSPYDSSSPDQDFSDRLEYIEGMSYNVNGAGCTEQPDGPLYATAASSHNLGAGTIDVKAYAATNAYGYESISTGPFGTTAHGHGLQAIASAHLSDWIYVTGPNPTATVTLIASLDYDFDSPPIPLNDSDWFNEAFDEDIRLLAPCGDYEQPDFGGEAQPPEGRERSELALGVTLQDEFESEVVCYEPPEGTPVCSTQWNSTHHGEGVHRYDTVYYEWIDGEPPNDADCSDDFLDVYREDEGSLAGSVSVQVEVATDQWIKVGTSLSVESTCEMSLYCALENYTGGPTQLSITSPNGTLVAWHGIAGLTRVPEPQHGIVAALAALAWLTRRPRS